MQTNFNRYQMQGILGTGGMGRVYKAYDTQLRRLVAIKVLITEASKKAEVDRFLREARATARLDHPNIIKVYDIGIEQGQPYFTMDCIEGVSLKSYAEHSNLSVRQISEIMIKVGKAVHYAHQEGVIHRDIKPSNVMIDKKIKPKVMDFGLAKMTKASKKLSKTGMIMGTLQYMPPEQAQGLTSAIDNRSDVYSLGAVLYDLLTKRPPVSGGTSFNIIYSILEKDPLAPRKIRKSIPKEIETICLKALEKNKEQRIGDCPLDKNPNFFRGRVKIMYFGPIKD